MVYRFKQEKKCSLVRVIQKLGQKSFNESANDRTLLTYVPLHSLRHVSRGFNQARMIALELSKHSPTPLPAISSLKRIKKTTPQGKLRKSERQDNVKNAFGIAFGSRKTIYGSRILLVDDVMTTGATLSEASRILLAAGAKDVSCWTFSRAI